MATGALMRTVLLTGARAPVALDLARRFATAGWRVVLADSASCRASAWAGIAAATVRLPPPRLAPAAFARALADTVADHRVDLLVPTCEEALHVARHRAALPATLRVATADVELLRQLHGKATFMELARGCGVVVPETQRVRDIDEARDWAGDAPVVLKPEFSRFGVHVRVHPDGLPAGAAPLAPVGPWLAQRHQPGDELCTYAVADRGRLLAHAAYRPRWRLARSASFYFDPVVSTAARDFAAALVARTGFTGQLGFDFIVGADGTLAVLECNPRATSGLHLFAGDDPLAAALAGDDVFPFAPAHERAAMLGPVMRTAGRLQAWRAGTLAAWHRDVGRADDVFGGRAAPVAGALVDFAALSATAMRRGISVRAASTHDIEWDGAMPA